ncbi:hypothetical protein JZ751_025068 [Albula glossodonta]|uniref:Orange domain-containing protein n=1 Tax=Albula glossodonta TaxID=121402 RepID=A0A8T2PMC5_9TELE|nr:hypothetical protein JZ751_025068 [Albula glossodonta]
MPEDFMEKTSSSPIAATPATMTTVPEKPKTASEHRKSSKPIMEKRRRARINESLGQLKTLILEALKKDVSTSMITTALNTDPTVIGKYRAGFSECMNEVTRFLSTCEGVNTEVRTRLLAHLASCMTQINAMNYPTQPQIPTGPHPAFGQGQPVVHIPSASPQGNAIPLNGVSCKVGSSGSLPSEVTKVHGGFQLVSATDGQFAILIPNAAFAPNGPIPFYPNNVSTPLPVAVSPGAASVTADSVWRPW